MDNSLSSFEFLIEITSGLNIFFKYIKSLSAISVFFCEKLLDYFKLNLLWVEFCNFNFSFYLVNSEDYFILFLIGELLTDSEGWFFVLIDLLFAFVNLSLWLCLNRFES